MPSWPTIRSSNRPCSEAEHLEPRFVHAEQEAVATERLAAFSRDGKRPNVLMIVFDDVGWGDFGCYGGGVAVGAPTPNLDRLARQGLLLTSCYSEPSCTPSRASLMTGRLPMRHGLLRPPMYGEPGGLQGEITIAQLLADAGYVTQAVGKWHMGENEESQPQNVGFDDFYGFLSVSDMYTEWRDPYFFPEVAYSEERTRWIENQPFNKCFVHATKGSPVENVEEVTIPVLSELDDKWATYSLEFMRRMAGEGRSRGSSTTAPAGAHFDNYPQERFLGSSPAKHPYKDTIVELDDIVGRLVARARGDRSAREHARLRHLGQRPGDGDLARRRVLAVPQRQGLDLGRRPAGAGHRLVARDDRRGPRVGRPVLAHGLVPDPAAAGRRRGLDARTTATSTASTRPRSCSAGDADSNRKYLYYWLGSTFSAVRVAEYKFMLASTSDDDRDVMNVGGFTGVTQKYTYGRLYNLYLDPKETRSYMVRKLAYLESFQSGIVNHIRTFAKYPPKSVVGGVG